MATKAQTCALSTFTLCTYAFCFLPFTFSLIPFPFCEAGTSTTVENALQIDPFMQNEPNFQKSQMNVTSYMVRDYENKSNWTLGENEPNTNPIKANTNPIKANTKPIKANIKPKQTQNEPNQTQFQTRCEKSFEPVMYMFSKRQEILKKRPELKAKTIEQAKKYNNEITQTKELKLHTIF